jgi:hypothetical protein
MFSFSGAAVEASDLSCHILGGTMFKSFSVTVINGVAFSESHEIRAGLQPGWLPT